MYLLLDNSLPEEITVTVSLDGKNTEAKIYNRQFVGSLLGAIDRALVDYSLDKKALQGVAVLGGAGRFTATRVAATVANMLAFTLQIPVLSVPALEAKNWLNRLKSRVVGSYMLPEYSGPPRLGGKNIDFTVEK